MYILVTGSAGFIGFNFCQAILKKDYPKLKIIGIDNLNNYYSKKLKLERLKVLKSYKNFNFINIDITNNSKLEIIFKKFKFKEVYNFAAQAGVRYSTINPMAYIKSNVLGFSNLIDLSKKYNIKKFFYASSSSVYGDTKDFPLKEKVNLNPKNLYAKTKKYNEEIAESFYLNYNFKSVGLRFFTIFGEWGRPDMFLYKLLISSLKKSKFYLYNNGNHYRDFTYINDVVKLLLKLRKKSITKNDIYNICSNNPISLKKIILLIKKDIKGSKIINSKLQPEDILKTHGHNKKILKKLKIKKLSNFENSLRNTVSWFNKNKSLF